MSIEMIGDDFQIIKDNLFFFVRFKIKWSGRKIDFIF